MYTLSLAIKKCVEHFIISKYFKQYTKYLFLIIILEYHDTTSPNPRGLKLTCQTFIDLFSLAVGEPRLLHHYWAKGRSWWKKESTQCYTGLNTQSDPCVTKPSKPDYRGLRDLTSQHLLGLRAEWGRPGVDRPPPATFPPGGGLHLQTERHTGDFNNHRRGFNSPSSLSRGSGVRCGSGPDWQEGKAVLCHLRKSHGAV